jgi:hypothetical protein
MAHPQNRGDPMPDTVLEEKKKEEVEIEEKPPEKQLAHVGIACKWCHKVGNHPVKRTYRNKMRVRQCLFCAREFQTWEATVQ